MTVNILPLLSVPPTLTTTLPVVAPFGTGTEILDAPQLVGVADIPLNFTVLVPFVDPKFDPVTVTDVPDDPLDGERLAITGAVAFAGTTTGTSVEYALVAPLVLYARIAK